MQQQNPVRKNVRQGLFMTVRPIFWPDSDPASQLASQRAFWMIDQGLGGWTELVKWGAVNILQVPEVDSDVGKSDVCKEGCN